MSGIGTISDTRLSALRRYVAVVALGTLVWEFAQMPLDTLWRTGTGGEIAVADLHCTGGDVSIATALLGLPFLMTERPARPQERFLAVAITSVARGPDLH